MDTTGKVYLVISIVVLIGMFAVFWLISRHAPKGTLLAVGVILWAVGRLIASLHTREMKLIGGICTFSGFVGGLFGLSDLLRKKKEPPQPPEQGPA